MDSKSWVDSGGVRLVFGWNLNWILRGEHEANAKIICAFCVFLLLFAVLESGLLPIFMLKEKICQKIAKHKRYSQKHSR